VLLSGNFQSEHVTAGESYKQRYYWNINKFKPQYACVTFR